MNEVTKKMMRPGQYSFILPPAGKVEAVPLPPPEVFKPTPVPRSMRETVQPPSSRRRP